MFCFVLRPVCLNVLLIGFGCCWLCLCVVGCLSLVLFVWVCVCVFACVWLCLFVFVGFVFVLLFVVLDCCCVLLFLV